VLFRQLEVPSKNIEIGLILETNMAHELKYENMVEKRTESWTQNRYRYHRHQEVQQSTSTLIDIVELQ
jgi:hypothetical protein